MGAIDEGGEGVLSAIKVFSNIVFLKPSGITPSLSKCVLHIVWALYYVYIVVEVTLNNEHGYYMAVGGRSSLRMSILNQL